MMNTTTIRCRHGLVLDIADDFLRSFSVFVGDSIFQNSIPMLLALRNITFSRELYAAKSSFQASLKSMRNHDDGATATFGLGLKVK
jgi:hypothetical protein